MFSTAIIVFRETLEIAMILGIVLAATRGLAGRTAWIIGGIFSGIFGAALVAAFAKSISDSLSGMGQEFFNATILFTAALFIGWTVVWMRSHARKMTMHLKQVGHDDATGKIPHYTLAVIIGLAVLREGSEIVLFIYSMILSGQNTSSIVGGSLLGLGLGATFGTFVYFGLLKIPARYTLAVTSWLLILLVSGLASQGANFLSAAGYFSDFSNMMWDSSWLLTDDSITGKALHSLIGYSARPTSIQLIFYFGTLTTLLAIMNMMDKVRTLAKISVAAMFVAACSVPSPAKAIDHMYSPNVNKGEAAFEYVGNRTFDSKAAKNNIAGHEVEFEYSATDWWKAILAGSFEKEPGERRQYEATQLESVLSLNGQGEDWMDVGILAAYGLAKERTAPNFLELKLLLQKDVGAFTHLANIGFEQSIGHYSDHTGGPDYSFLWSSRYRMNQYLQPGFEYQSDMGKGRTLGKYNEQYNYLGPALYGSLVGNFKYEAAYLFGVSTTASQGAARVLLEYEMQF